MAYKPFAESYPAFRPFNHFDDDILKFYFLYQEQSQLHPYQPYWVPEIFGGIAVYANTYASHFSTLNWLLLLGPVEFTYPLRLLAFVWIAGMSMFALAREVGLRAAPSFLAGLSYMFSSIFMTLLLRWWLHAPFAWFPLVLLFSLRGMRSFSLPSVLGAAFFLSCSFLDGFFQSSASILIALGIFLLVVGWNQRGLRGLGRAVGFGSAAVVMAFAFSAIMWLPQLEYFMEDAAKGSSRVAGLYYGKNLWERVLSVPLLVSALFPAAIGSVRTMDLGKLAKSHLQDFSLFIGTIPLLLGLSTWRFRSRFDEAEAGLWALALAGLVVPIFTPVDRYLYFRFFAVYVTGIACLAAVGWQRMQEEENRRCLLRWSLCSGLILLTILCGSVALRILIWARPGWLEAKARAFVIAHLDQSTLGSRNPDWMIERGLAAVRYWSLGAWDYNLSWLLAALGVWVCWQWSRRKLTDTVFGFVAISLTFLQLALFIRSWHGFHDPQKFPLYPANEVSRFFQREDPERKFRATVDDFNGIGKEKQIIPANSNETFGYATLEGFDGLRPFTPYDNPMEQNDYSELAERNVRYVITNPEPLLRDPRLTLRQRGRVAIYEIQGAKGRGQVVYDYEVHSRKEMVAAILARKRFAAGHPWLERETSVRPVKLAMEPAELISSDFRQSVYRLKNRAPGIFLASESFYPGWKAELDGRPVELVRANGTMRAVPVPAGGGMLTFRFEPDSYRYGLRISLASLALALIALFTGKIVRKLRNRRGMAIA